MHHTNPRLSPGDSRMETQPTPCPPIPARAQRLHRSWALPLVLLTLAAALPAQVQTGPSSFQASGRAGRRIQLGNVGVGGTPSPLPAVQSWRLIGRPAGSQAVLDDPASPLLSFLPDRQGTYVAEGAVAGGAPARLFLSVGPSQMLTPAKLHGNETGDIVVGDKTYPGPGSTGINVVVLNRSDLTLVDQQPLSNVAAAKAYLDDALNNPKYANDPQHGSPVMFLLASGSSVDGKLSDLAPELGRLGATGAFYGITYDFPFSFIGAIGLAANQAYQVGGGGLTGHFVNDVNNHYTFIQLDYLPFTITPSTDITKPCQIQVGNQVYTSADAYKENPPPYGFSGGFFLLVLGSSDLKLVSEGIYPTLADTLEHSIAQQQALSQTLSKYQGNPAYLVLLVSFGNVHQGASAANPEFSSLALQISKQDGTYEAVYNMNTGDTYSLASWTDPVDTITPHAKEAGSRLNDPNQLDTTTNGALHGVLGRAHQGNWYYPVSSAAGLLNQGAEVVPSFDLYSVVGQNPTPFPALDAASYRLISERTLQKSANPPLDPKNQHSDLRSQYDNIGADPGVLLSDMQYYAAQNGTDAACTAGTQTTIYCQVYNTLFTEVSNAAEVQSLYKILLTIYTASNSNVSLVLQSATAAVNEALKPPPQSSALSITSTVIEGVLSLAATALGGPEGYAAYSIAVGCVNAAFGIGTGVALDVMGNSSAAPDVTVQAGQLASQAVTAFEQQQNALGTIFNLILADPGWTSRLANLQLTTDKVTTLSVAKALTVLDKSTRVSTYQSLLTIDYNLRVWNVQNWESYTTPGYYKYDNCPPLGCAVSIFKYFDAAGGDYWQYNYLEAPSHRAEYGTVFRQDFIILTRKGTYDDPPAGFSYNQMSKDLRKTLFEDVGISKIQFFRHWPLERRYCGISSFDQGDYNFNNPLSIRTSNCDYTKPQPNMPQ